MTSATIPLSRFESADLPAVCAASGVPAANVYGIRAGNRELTLPLHSEVARSISRVQNACKVAFVATIGIFLIGLADHKAFIMQCASVPLVVALGLLWAAISRVPKAQIRGDQVKLDHVHENFVVALTSPPGKCSGCTSVGSCSLTEMANCEGHDHRSSTTDTNANVGAGN